MASSNHSGKSAALIVCVPEYSFSRPLVRLVRGPSGRQCRLESNTYSLRWPSPLDNSWRGQDLGSCSPFHRRP
ncbi:hypothetical protein CONLIGDRAFT_268992 [Coniochaeta ligniaria NRRL 30616]|uniref:Uncharacterized protein n=1 Tax=Coniochaeta ligniaria NRRL 30616 TaxID=1408157 RepID=A0A1J7IY39_9PEZI|nr:hypothetical protein CONLIGDRAFT_268992 [Coniochaeta ligniaria NRRL 30616]